jgi:hypothetical protein
MHERGAPHAQPIALPRDAHGQDRWLAFVGPPEVALGAWRVTRAADGTMHAEPVAPWPAGVRVVGGVVEADVPYVMLETLPVLDQPGGLRGVWSDVGAGGAGGAGRAPSFGSPLALADVHDAADLAARLGHLPAAGSTERTSVALLSTLRAASTSAEALTRSLASEGADVGLVWQGTFVQHAGRLDGEGSAPSPLAEKALAIVRAGLTTQACGAEACEAWTDTGHAVIRFAVEGGRWVVRGIFEDAPIPRGQPSGAPHEVAASPAATATDTILAARAGEGFQVLGEAPLAGDGSTIGAAMTDLSHDSPVVVVHEGAAVRLFPLDAGTVRAEAVDAHWDAAFADVDGDGRTDVVVHLAGKRLGGDPVEWSQAFLAPPASVQVTALEPDLATSLATLGALDARAAAKAAASPPRGPVAHDDACRVLAAASTPAGFRKIASPDARVLLFDEPGMPTWRAKVVPVAKISADDVRGLGAHCAELVCSASRPYCSWASGADSLHAWFTGRDQLSLAGAADYQGE